MTDPQEAGARRLLVKLGRAGRPPNWEEIRHGRFVLSAIHTPVSRPGLLDPGSAIPLSRPTRVLGWFPKGVTQDPLLSRVRDGLDHRSPDRRPVVPGRDCLRTIGFYHTRQPVPTHPPSLSTPRQLSEEPKTF